jgi:sugar lactone lactonase YvrE
MRELRLGALALVVFAGCSRDLSLPPPPGPPSPGTVYGRVVYAVPGKLAREPAGGAQVVLLSTSLAATCAADGAFLLEGLTQSTGTLLFRFDADGDGTIDRQRSIELSDIAAGPGRQIALGEVAVSENAAVHGRVLREGHVYETGGNSGSVIFVPAGPYTAHTNDDGSYSLGGLPEGHLRFSVFHQGYLPQTFDDVALRSGEDFSFRDIVLKPDPSPAAQGALEGRLVFLPAVDNVDGVVVTAVDSTSATTAGVVSADNSYKVAAVPAGLYDVVVTRPGYSTAAIHNVLVSGGQVVTLPVATLQAGTSTGCFQGKACTPSAPCRAGVTDCQTGTAVCKESGNGPDGAPCGTGQVCHAGACLACQAGDPCTPPNACHQGVVSCDLGVKACNDTGAALANGAACAANRVCSAGACTDCVSGGACVPLGNACHVGALSCSAAPECTDTLSNAANGTPCGTNLFCSGGACVACVPDASCTPTAAPCHTGKVNCSTGTPVCDDAGGTVTDGVACATGKVCNAGVCAACVTGANCTPSNPCHVGSNDCATGASVCVDTGVSLANGDACGAGQVCQTGACVNSGFAVVAGDAQSALPDQTLTPVTVRLANATGVAIAGAAITVTSPAGADASPRAGVTDVSGQFTFVPRVGRTLGATAFSVSSPGQGQVAVAATVAAAPAGTLYTVVNVNHGAGNDGVPGPATTAHISNTRDLAVASDGTIYFADYGDGVVRRLSPAGVLTNVTPFPYAVGVALDEAHNTLYVTDQNASLVKAVNLASGAVTTIAGGGTAPGPAFGDGAPANAAALSAPTHLALGPDGKLYVTDYGHDRIRRINLSTGLIEAWFGPQGTGSDPVAYYTVTSTGGQVVWDAAGDAYISGDLVGTSTGVSGYSCRGVVRRDRTTGALTHVAGAYSGSTADGVPATTALFASQVALAFDAAGDLFVADPVDHKVRRIEATTGRIATIAGTGTLGSLGDYGPATLGRLSGPNALVVDAAGNLIVGDSGNTCLRVVASGGGATAASATLSAVSGNGQSARVDQVAPAVIGAKLLDATGAPLAGYAISWSAADPGGVVYAAQTQTNSLGVAYVNVRVGLAPGPAVFRASFVDLHGVPAAGSPATFTLTAAAADAGIVFTAVNVDHSLGNNGVPGPATMAHVGTTRDLAVASNGAVYFTDSYGQVRKLSPAGALTNVAQVDDPFGVALDETNNILYVASYGPGLVRAVNLATGAVSTVAGGGTAPSPGYGDGQPATAAALSLPTHLAIGPDGKLYVTDYAHDRIRRIDLSTGIIEAWFGAQGAASDAVAYSTITSVGGHVAWDAVGDAYISGYIYGTSPGGGGYSSNGVVRRDRNTGALSHVAGAYSGSTADGLPATSAGFTAAPAPAFDAAGNLFLVDSGLHRVRRVEAATGRITTVAGTGSPGWSGDFGPATLAQLSGPTALVISPAGTLFVSDSGNTCLRVVAAVGTATATNATLSVASGDTQTLPVDQLAPAVLGARLLDASGAPLAGYFVSWVPVDAGGAVYAARTQTDAAGVAYANVRVGLAAGPYRFRASFVDLHGAPAVGSPATFTLTASGPAAGTLFTAVNIDHGGGNDGSPGPATLAHIGNPRDLTVASTGAVYFADPNYNLVRRLSPEGVLSNVATITNPYGLALDETSNVLYVSTYTDNLVKAVNLTNGAVTTFAGGGTAPGPGFGDGQPATAAVLSAPTHLALGPDGKLYVTDQSHERIRRINLSTGVIEAWFGAQGVGTDVVAFSSVTLSGANGGQVLWDAAGDAYITGGILGTSTGNSTYACLGVVRRNHLTGALTHVAGAYSGSTADGVLATATVFGNPPGIALDAAGNLFLSQVFEHRVRRVDATTGVITTYAGTGTFGATGDYGPAAAARLYGPVALAFSRGPAAGHLVIGDAGNFALRVVW